MDYFGSISYERLSNIIVLNQRQMSLFKLKTLWSKAFSDEEFDERHLAVGKIGRQASIALGNFQGKLRVFVLTKGKELQAKLIYDNQFEGGIIEVKYVSHPDQRIRNNTIGVLFFRRFAFIYFEQKGDAYQPRIMPVQVEPSFGIGLSPISVMTLNSTIQYLNPLEIQKIKVGDPIYPFTRSMNKIYFADGQELVEVEGSTQQWKIVVGRMKQLFVFMDSIVIIGQRALWQVSQAKIIKTKVMEEQISCGTISIKSPNSYTIIVANFTGQLYVYSSNYQLLWALKLQYVPLKIFVCEHEQIKGALAILSEEGNLEIAYSGVQIPDTVIEPLSQKIDFAAVQSETQQLLLKLKNKQQPSKKADQLSTQKAGYKLYFTPIEKSYQHIDNKEKYFQIDGKLIKSTLVCEIISRQNLRNFNIQISLPFNLYSPINNKELKIVKPGQKISFSIYASNQSFPYDKDLKVIIRYDLQEQRGPPYIKIEDVAIPMALQCSITGYESKENFENKIIIKSNNQLPAFNEIFPELFPKDSQSYQKALRFTLANGIQCIITYNKGLNKAKVESPLYSGLCYIVTEYSNHIRSFNTRVKSKLELSVQIPLQQFFANMKDHYDCRLKLKSAFKDVQIKSQQFRSTQKKLLIKMKEKMSNLGSVDKLLEYTYQKLIQSAGRYEEVLHQMQIVNHNLCVAIKLIIQLLFIRTNPSQKAKGIAIGILGYEKQSMDRGWQQKIYANSCHYLNKKYNKNDHISLDQLQKIPLFVISRVNNGDWN